MSKKKKVTTFAEYFKLGKTQSELDFVDVPVDGTDIKLFIDPYALTKWQSGWYKDCHETIYSYFDQVIALIRLGKRTDALQLLNGLHESNETRLGYSPRNQGAAIGRQQAMSLYDALRASRAVETGVLKDIEECNLMVKGVDRDKVSDMTTNVIKAQLIQYTQEQCDLFGVPTSSVPVNYVFDKAKFEWTRGYYDLPVDKRGKPIILVPKAMVRIIPVLNADEYYQHYALNYLQDEHYSAASSLCRTLKSGELRPPTKKVLTEEITKVGDVKTKKEYLYEFSTQNPDVLAEYRDVKLAETQPLSNEEIEKVNQQRQQDIDAITQRIQSIPAGKNSADDYHNEMIGAYETIFYPLLTNPKKEQPINDGIKRIDIRFINSAQHGFFSSLRPLKGIPASYVFVECKNYTNDPENPEVDQLAMRFNDRRGKFGILAVRTVNDKTKMLARCRAAFNDGHGAIIVITDEELFQLLEYRKRGDNQAIDQYLEEKLSEVIN